MTELADLKPGDPVAVFPPYNGTPARGKVKDVNKRFVTLTDGRRFTLLWGKEVGSGSYGFTSIHPMTDGVAERVAEGERLHRIARAASAISGVGGWIDRRGSATPAMVEAFESAAAIIKEALAAMNAPATPRENSGAKS